MNMKDFHAWVQGMRHKGSDAAQNLEWQNRNQTPIEQPKKQEPEVEEVLEVKVSKITEADR